MKLIEYISHQLDREAAVSTRVLECVPEGKPDWKPHEKSMPLGYLATLVATMPSWIAMALNQDELDLSPPGGPAYAPAKWDTRSELLKSHEEAVAQSREALHGTSDEHLMTTWRLLFGGRVAIEDPRHAVIADTFNHIAHHRGQLSVYLRLNEIALPRIYGPSADETGFE